RLRVRASDQCDACVMLPVRSLDRVRLRSPQPRAAPTSNTSRKYVAKQAGAKMGGFSRAAHLSSLYVSTRRHALGLWTYGLPASPRVVRTVEVDEPVVRVELDPAQRLAPEVVLPHVARRVRAPHLGGVVVLLRRAVAEGEQRMD